MNVRDDGRAKEQWSKQENGRKSDQRDRRINEQAKGHAYEYADRQANSPANAPVNTPANAQIVVPADAQANGTASAPINAPANGPDDGLPKERLLIIGAGGHGKSVADVALKMGKWKSIAFLDDNEGVEVVIGVKVIGKSDDACKYIFDSDIFVGVGNSAAREKIMQSLESCGASIPVLIHPDAVIGTQVEIGAGTVVMAGVVVNCCTRIGKGCIINTGATVDHDNIIEDYTHISPGAHLAGAVKVGRGTWVGIGCSVSNNVAIAGGCVIGAGAVVVGDISEAGTYVGVPARKINKEAGMQG